MELRTRGLSGEFERLTKGALATALGTEDSAFDEDVMDFALVARVIRVGAAASVGVFVRERVMDFAFEVILAPEGL